MIQAATRRALIDAARQVFVAKGYTAGRIADVTAAAGVSVGTFYTHFGGKRELLDALLGELAAEMFDAPDGDRPVEEHLRLLNRRYLGAFADDAALWYAVERAALTSDEVAGTLAAHRERQVLRIAGLIRDRAGRGLLPLPDDPEFTAFSLVAMTEELAYIWFVYESAPDLDDAARHLSVLWCRLLGAGR
ncbi:TetR/AcrR family transcriptional regulator [Actinomadura sp. NAK00032]|uniref:TetR/AcrR family transcriptional regulator n=1 Tax=Actinomadura sp. NAK00032 TaxID=2742128 RepID=UPI0015912C95|nr:TetR/AcrR family transcriptional regulator [Actinomadura sp. NAK00032]QKW39350.1 TetR/AcrR family transcriptional regulator [Actinomadura sp. NAK00032]